jgi:glycosyltransferase involved in cell wall biosynthesis
MLGWEYPPRFAGGLGKACQGLAQAMAKQGAEVFFVLPSFPDRVSEPRLEVVGARECMIEAGWDPATQPAMNLGASNEASAVKDFALGPGGAESAQGPGSITFFQSEARLSAYGAAPEGPISRKLHLTLMQGLAGWDEPEDGVQPRRSVLGKITERKKEGSLAADSSQGQASKTLGGSVIYGKNFWGEIEQFCFTVRHMAEGHEVDVVHAHDWMTFPAAFEFSRITGVPVFLHVHATEYDRSGESLNNDVFRIEREGFRRATHIFAVSKYTAGIIERLYGINKRKISVIHNAPEAHATDFLKGPGGERSPRVVFLGRLTFQKGPDHFLRAAALVAQADPSARFVFCGTGDMMDQLRRMTHDLGLESRVHFAGFVDPAGVDQVLQDSRVLVMPSVSEPFGLVALEAIRCGIPVILSKQSGVREVLSRALQVDFWDHDRLADQMLAALRLPGLSGQLVKEGWEQLQTLSWEKSGQKVIDTYRKILSSTFAQAVSMGGSHGR